MKVKKAEITAFLSLIVVLLISFIFGIIEITVIQTEKNLSMSKPNILIMFDLSYALLSSKVRKKNEKTAEPAVFIFIL